MYRVSILALVGISASLTPPDLTFIQVCESELISDWPECEAARELTRVVPLVVSLYDEVKVHAIEIDSGFEQDLSPIDGVLIESKIASFVSGREQERQFLENLASTCSTQFLKKVFQRFLERKISDVRNALTELLTEAKKTAEKNSAEFRKLAKTAEADLKMLRDEIQYRITEGDLHEQRFSAVRKILTNYKQLASDDIPFFHPRFTMYKKMAETKYEKLAKCAPESIQANVKELISFLVSLKQRDELNYEGLWNMCKGIYEKIHEPIPLLLQGTTGALADTASRVVIYTPKAEAAEAKLKELRKLVAQLAVH